jgi:hypothetical protein
MLRPPKWLGVLIEVGAFLLLWVVLSALVLGPCWVIAWWIAR